MAINIEKNEALDRRIRTLEASGKELLTALEDASRFETWNVKLPDGSVYGPVSIQDLYDWAVQCRLGPEHSVSRDDHSWQKAQDLQELRLQWMVELEDGQTYGPVNVFAIEHLLKEGMVRPDAPVHHTISGIESRADDLSFHRLEELRVHQAWLTQHETASKQAIKKAMDITRGTFPKHGKPPDTRLPHSGAIPPQVLRIQLGRKETLNKD